MMSASAEQRIAVHVELVNTDPRPFPSKQNVRNVVYGGNYEKAIEMAACKARECKHKAVLMRVQAPPNVNFDDDGTLSASYTSCVVSVPAQQVQVDDQDGRAYNLMVHPDLLRSLGGVDGTLNEKGRPCHVFENFRQKMPDDKWWPVHRFVYECDIERLRRNDTADADVCPRNSPLLERDEVDRRVLAALFAFVRECTVRGIGEEQTMSLRRVATCEAPKISDDGVLSKMSVHGAVHLFVPSHAHEELVFADVNRMHAFNKEFKAFCEGHAQFGVDGADSMFICEKPKKNGGRAHCLCDAADVDVEERQKSIVFIFDNIYNQNRAFRLFGASKILDPKRSLRDARVYTLDEHGQWGQNLYESNLLALAELMGTQPLLCSDGSAKALAIKAIDGAQRTGKHDNNESVAVECGGKRERRVSLRAEWNRGTLVPMPTSALYSITLCAPSTMEKRPVNTLADVILATIHPENYESAEPRDSEQWFAAVCALIECLCRSSTLDISVSDAHAGFAALLDAACSSDNIELVSDLLLDFVKMWKSDVADDNAKSELRQRIENIGGVKGVPEKTVINARVRLTAERQRVGGATGESCETLRARIVDDVLLHCERTLKRKRSTAQAAKRARRFSRADVPVRYAEINDELIETFPPCIQTCVRIHQSGENGGIKNTERILASAFLHDIGVSREASIRFAVSGGRSSKQSTDSFKGAIVNAYSKRYSSYSCTKAINMSSACPYKQSSSSPRDACTQCKNKLKTELPDIEDLSKNLWSPKVYQQSKAAHRPLQEATTAKSGDQK